MSDQPQLPLRILLGATLNRTFTLRNRKTGVPIDLAGWAPSLIIARQSGGNTLLEITTANGFSVPAPTTLGQVVLSYFAANPGFVLPIGDYWYRMRLTASPTNVWALWGGPLEVAYQ